MTRQTVGPLQNTKIIEIAGIGPGPFCAMLLADMGAEVLRIDRPGASVERARTDILNRGRRSIAIDLKTDAGRNTCLALIRQADGLLEGFRPGVMERLGLGPQHCHAVNERLVFGRMTGWGQHGPLASTAGHDIDYIALSGALHAIGEPGRGPVVPLNLVGDFGGGAMLLAFGMVCGLLEASRSGQGQVIDAAMTDGAALLMAMMYGWHAQGQWSDARGSNLLDGGAHFYGTYRCADDRWLAIGAIEPQFYAQFRALAGIADDPAFDVQHDRQVWPAQRQRLAAVIRRRSRDEWCAVFDGSDACVAPVLDMNEAPQHPHNRARQTFMEIHGTVQPAPAPRFSRTPGAVASPPPLPGEHTRGALRDWGFDDSDIEQLLSDGVVQQAVT
ncbi:MAG: CoA transferase [Gammaproteobacteria bacterium]|nr:CoA transferase [Gammaproteobacteria bacterium]